MLLKEIVKPGVVALDHINAKFLSKKRFRVEYLAQLPLRKGDPEVLRVEIGESYLWQT